MDPFLIIDFLDNYATYLQIFDVFANWMYGKNIDHFNKGRNLMQLGLKKGDISFIKKAINEFDYINDAEDKKYVVAAKCYCIALCYVYICEFSLSYYYLDKLDAIEIGVFTKKGDKIRELQSEGKTCRKKIKRIENLYKASLIKEANEKKLQARWRLIAISTSVISGVCILAIIVYALFL